MQRITVKLPEAPKSLSKTGTTVSGLTRDPSKHNKKGRRKHYRGKDFGAAPVKTIVAGLGTVEAPYLAGAGVEEEFGAAGSSILAKPAEWVDLGREHIMCSSPRVEETVVNHHAFLAAQQKSERYMAAMGVMPTGETPFGPTTAAAATIGADSPQKGANSPLRSTAHEDVDDGADEENEGNLVTLALLTENYVSNPLPPELQSMSDTPGVTPGDEVARSRRASQQQHQATQDYTANKHLSSSASPRKSPRTSSASFASNSIRFKENRPRVPPVGHYSIRYHMVDAENHVPTIVPMEENKVAAQEYRRQAEQKPPVDHMKNGTPRKHGEEEPREQQPPTTTNGTSDDGMPTSARERAKQRAAAIAPRPPSNSSAFASVVPQLMVKRPTPGCHIPPREVGNEGLVSGQRHKSTHGNFISLQKQLPRHRVPAATARTSCAPQGIVSYDFEPQSARLKGLCEFARQSPRAVGENTYVSFGQQQRRTARNDIKTDGGRSTDYADMRVSGDSVNSANKARVGTKGMLDFEKQTRRKPLHTFHGLCATDFVDTDHADRVVKGPHMQDVNFKKQTSRPAVERKSDCAVDNYDKDYTMVDTNHGNTMFEHFGSHDDRLAFGNIAAFKKKHYQVSEPMDTKIDETRPKISREVDIAKLAPRKPAKHETEDPSSKVINPYKLDPQLLRERAQGNPHMARAISRDEKEKVLSYKNPRVREAADYYDMPKDAMYNPALTPRREALLEFDKMPKREKMKGGRNVIEMTVENGPHLGPGTYFQD